MPAEFKIIVQDDQRAAVPGAPAPAPGAPGAPTRQAGAVAPSEKSPAEEAAEDQVEAAKDSKEASRLFLGVAKDAAIIFGAGGLFQRIAASVDQFDRFRRAMAAAAERNQVVPAEIVEPVRVFDDGRELYPAPRSVSPRAGSSGAPRIGGPVAAPSAGTAGAANLATLLRIGAVVAPFVAAIGAAAAAVAGFAAFVARQTQELVGFSDVVAAAAARTEVRRELALLRRGERIGPELARAEDLRSRVTTAITNSITELQVALLRAIEPYLPLIEAGVMSLEVIAELLRLMNATLTRFDPRSTRAERDRADEDIRRSRERINDILMGRPEDEDPFLDQLFADLSAVLPPAAGGGAPRRRGTGAFGGGI